MKVSDFDYELPKHLIAQHPSDKRENSKMMVIDVNSKEISHHHFYDLIDLLRTNDVIVLNNTKVIPARLHGYKDLTHAKVELLILSIEPSFIECLVKNAKVVKEGTKLIFGEGKLITTCIEVKENGIRKFKFEANKPLDLLLDEIGEIPLPPYIVKDNQDYSRYQTVYAQKPGSAAAPTAGLHFTDEILQKCKDKGVKITNVTLHVGLSTFKPVEVLEVSKHVMHSEKYEISESASEILNKAKANNQRIIAVGTTSARTLESNYSKFNEFRSEKSETAIFIYPGYNFKSIDGLITNFHLPKSTLLMMVSAFSSTDLIKEAYKTAIEKSYRFFSFGDSMFLYRR